MKPILSCLLILVFSFSSYAQKTNLEYEFDNARALLAQRDIEGAIELLRNVYVEDENNSNINFLMGAAYTELPGYQKEAIFHLKKALPNVNENYKVGSYAEKGAPIHLYYYLAISFVENDLCAEAFEAYEKFKTHKKRVNAYFIQELERHLQKCPFEKKDEEEDWKKIIEPPADYDPKFIKEKEEENLDSLELAERGLVTQKLEYTTNAPLYGVQIGSNLNPSPTSSFKNVKNVDVFIDNQGIIRYVVGHFSYKKQAEKLLENLIEKGFNDAFVVNVNDERKYSNEVISYNNINLRAKLSGPIDFYVQLGAFEDTIPQDMVELYFEVDGIQEVKSEKLTLLMVGAFPSYQEALNEVDKIQLNGFDDAFIVAYYKGKKISLEEAIRNSKE